MKKFLSFLFTGVIAITLAVGCSKEGVDTAGVEKAFSSADAGLKSSADKVIAAVKSGDYAGATAELKKLAAEVKLTPEQKQSLQDLLAQVQSKVTDVAKDAAGSAEKAVKDAGDAASKAAEDAKKALGK